MIDSGAPWLLSLLRFTSPTLPIGAYAYSRGLEQAVHAGDVHDEVSARGWILGLLQHTAARLDGAVLWRLLAALARDDQHDVEGWNARLLASRESAELRLEDTQLGAALARLLVGQGVDAARAFTSRDDVCYATPFALAAISFEIPAPAALQGFLWAQAESQCSAAVRLIPLGQTAGQRLLGACAGVVPVCAELAREIPDADIGAFAPGLAIASALHETQYTRLFRS
jgi:urease accessory protein